MSVAAKEGQLSKNTATLAGSLTSSPPAEQSSTPSAANLCRSWSRFGRPRKKPVPRIDFQTVQRGKLGLHRLHCLNRRVAQVSCFLGIRRLGNDPDDRLGIARSHQKPAALAIRARPI